MSEEQAQQRIKADPKVGLTKEQVQRQIELDLVNHNADAVSYTHLTLPTT